MQTALFLLAAAVLVSDRTVAAFAFVGLPYLAARTTIPNIGGVPPPPSESSTRISHRLRTVSAVSQKSGETTSDNGDSKIISLEDLFVMDVVVFARRTTGAGESGDRRGPLELGAIQENGNVAPLSAWTLEGAYSGIGSGVDDVVEFVVDEDDMYPGLTDEEVEILSVLGGDVLGYGSRQVGGGKGPGNPHGEESELLYYIDRSVLEGEREDEREVRVVINPDLEVLW